MSPLFESINGEIAKLDEAHRLGQLTREAYRERRRQLLNSLCGSDSTTARKPIVARVPPATNPRGPSSPLPEPVPPRTATGRRSRFGLIAGLGILMAGAAGGLFWWLHKGGAAPSGPVAGLTEPAADPAAKLNLLARGILDDDRWDAESIDAFLSAWVADDVQVRRAALLLPAVMELRDQVESKRRVADLLKDGTATATTDPKSVALHRLDDELREVP